MISRENTPGNYAASPDAPPVELDPVYDYLWNYFRSEEHRRQQESWFPAPPPEQSEIKKQMLEECFRYPTTHWLLRWDQRVKPKHPAHKLIERISHMRVGVEEVTLLIHQSVFHAEPRHFRDTRRIRTGSRNL